MALFVMSSADAAGDAKLKLTEASSTDDSAGEEVAVAGGGSPLAAGGGSPLAADAAACSCLFFA